MQNVDRISHVNAFSQPRRKRRAGVEIQSVSDVRGAKRLDGVVTQHGRRGNIRQHPPVWRPEFQRSIQ